MKFLRLISNLTNNVVKNNKCMASKFLMLVGCIIFSHCSFAQQKDTVIVNLAKTSKIIITVGDAEDLEVLKHYDFQRLFEDVLLKFEEKKKGISQDSDSTKVADRPTEKTDSSAVESEEDESWKPLPTK